MISLHGKTRSWDAQPFVMRLAADGADTVPAPDGSSVLLPPDLRYLKAGDVIRVVPAKGEIFVLYRVNSPSNAMFLTGRCNSSCIMCSQPPRNDQDGDLVDMWLAAIPLMDPATAALGITGGEPTLLGRRLLCVLQACRDHLPDTSVHMLTNGRMLNYLSLCQAIADVGLGGRLTLGIPLYSDLPAWHDYVVQARGAFDQTIRGMMNAKRCGLGVEIRVVVHRQSAGRLPGLARFITRNLPFVDHVALMGLELMGYAKTNRQGLWIDPADYQHELCEAVHRLAEARLAVSIYNHQLCVLDRSLWGYARQSISDWKNEYLPVCDQCGVKNVCGGFFSSGRDHHSLRIRAIVAADDSVRT